MATLDELISRNPLEAVKAPKVQLERPEIYTLGEMKKILSATSGKYRAFFQLAFFSGMRPGEIIALKWSNVNFQTKQILVDSRIREGEVDLPKGGKIRQISMLPQAEDALRLQQKDTFITHMLQTGQNETWLTQQIGHDEISTTRKHYTGNLKLDETKFLDTIWSHLKN